MYPPVGFHFRILFKGLDPAQFTDIGFQSITGLEAFINSNETHTFDRQNPAPEAVSFSTLVLRRAVVDIKESPLIQWISLWINKEKQVPLKEVYIELLNEEHHPYMRWGITDVRPKSWKLGELNAEKSEVLIETIELSYTKLIFDPKEQVKQPSKGKRGN